jgi:hypothetical protein
MALTAFNPVQRRGPPSPGSFGYQVAPGEQIWGGGLVGLNAAGYLQRAQTAGTQAIVGIANRDFNNTASAVASSSWVMVDRGFWVLPVTGATPAGIDQPVYAIDDNTLTMVVPGSGDAASYVAGNPNFAVAGAQANGLGRAGANTGNGSIGTIVAASTAKPGSYLLLFSAATAFTVQDPQGDWLKTQGATGSAFVDGGLSFTVTAGGTAFVANDSLTITVTETQVPLLVGTLSGFDKGTAVVRIKGS